MCGDVDDEGTAARELHVQDQRCLGHAHHHAGGLDLGVYAFVIFGLTPILWPEYETQILYWSNFLQLIFLPVITVGTAILNRDSEKRAMEDHTTIRREFDLLKEVNGSHRAALAGIAEGIRELVDRSRAVTNAPASTDDGALKG
ncbi:MAG: hypothetical protein ACSLE4_11600 [Methyloceanibacter sp.]|uniref:hypothetical protein n=1 Tax=Methyloceanibacter sp. TaxID=1965321 RepID=UPI003EE394E3